MGYAHPDYLLEQLTSSQLSEWEAFDRIDPIGDWRDEYHFSFLASLITNIAIKINGKEGSKLTNVDDFKFEWGKTEEENQEQLAKQIKEVFMTFKKNK